MSASDEPAQPQTERSAAAPVEQMGYTPKPPLWQSTQKRSLLARIIGAVLMIGVVAVLAVGLEGYLLSVPMGQVEVTVVRVEGGTPQEERPAAFRHVVALPDGSEARFTSERLHPPGEKLIVTAARGRLTGRIRLGEPFRLLPSPGAPR